MLFGGGVGVGLALVLFFLLEWGYYIVCELLTSGRSPGKLVLGLRVVRLDGSPVELADVVLRNLLRAADSLPAAYGIGVGAMLADHRLRRLGDMVAGTIVVIEGSQRVLGAVQIVPPVSEVERQALPAGVSLDRDELLAIETLLRRRRRLTAARTEELAKLLGPGLQDRTGIEADSWERVLTLAYAVAVGKER